MFSLCGCRGTCHIVFYTLNPAMIKITGNPIETEKVIAAAESLKAGAVNVFIGTVRNESKGRPVRWLEYEAYEAMAVSEIKKITDEATRRWNLTGCAVAHRTGTLKPNEIAVVVAVSCGHRKESFEACQYIIDTIKEKVPIFKKEVFEDGEEWVSAHP